MWGRKKKIIQKKVWGKTATKEGGNGKGVKNHSGSAKTTALAERRESVSVGRGGEKNYITTGHAKRKKKKKNQMF